MEKYLLPPVKMLHIVLQWDLSSEDNKGVDYMVTLGGHVASQKMTLFPVTEKFYRYAIAFLLPLTSVVSRPLLAFFPFQSHTLPS